MTSVRSIDEARPKDPASRRLKAASAKSDFWADVYASGVFAFAVFALIVSLVKPWRHYFESGTDVVSEVSLVVVPNLVYVALLFVLAVALRRRLIEAWWMLMVWALGIPQVFRLARILGLHQNGPSRSLVAFGFILILVVMVQLVRVKSEFRATNAPGADLRAIAVAIFGTGATLLTGGWLVSEVGRSPDFGTSVAYVLDVLAGFIGFTEPLDQVWAPFWARFVIAFVGAAVVLGAAFVWFRAPKGTRYLDAADEARVRVLLGEFGDGDSLGYFATRRDKSVVWDTGSPDTARSGVSYRVVKGVCLASGSPLGDPSRWSGAIHAWQLKAKANGWSLAVMGAGQEAAAAYASVGLIAYEIGDEAILDLATFDLEAPAMKAVRHAVNRIQRHGYSLRIVRHSALTPDDFAALDAAASNWRGDGGDERGFSMALGRLGDQLDGDCVLVQAFDEAGELRGFLSFVPWGRKGLSLDLMRRDPGGENGLVEFLVTGLARAGRDLGVARVSLNFAMFREAFERGASIGAGPIARVWRRALMLASGNWQLESLYRSNAKYLPDWAPRFICFEYVSDLPKVGLATGSAEGFLTRPTLSLALSRGKAAEAGSLDRATDRYADSVRAMLPEPVDQMAAALAVDHLPEQMKVRREKLDRIREQGINPYPVNYARTDALADIRTRFSDLPPDSRTGVVVGVAGRVMLKRDGGKLCFSTVRDGSGDMQVMVSLAEVGPEELDRWKRIVDLGDHVGVTGEVITSKKGELSVMAASFALTAKSLRPLPEKHKGLTDPESRARMRYVDLIVRPEARSTAAVRSRIVRSVRDSLHARGFIEVETPMLQLIHGGANARPFETHINAYNMDVYLRIATELHLKRLLVGGMEKVFEIGRQFRNEGADSSHNPEFTSLEMYQTYADYQDMRILTQEIIQEAATAVFGAPVARRMQPDGTIAEFDLSGEWPHKTLLDAVSEALGEQLTADSPIEIWNAHTDRLGIEYDRNAGWGAALEALYEELCEQHTTLPTFYMDYPKATAPLTKAHRDDPRFAEKWDLVCWGAEQGTAYSELNDPVDQRERLVAQSLLAAAGNPEAMQVDEDFLRALEYGMPPTGGQGMGIDRLVMTLTGLNIRETILFPMVKPE